MSDARLRQEVAMRRFQDYASNPERRDMSIGADAQDAWIDAGVFVAAQHEEKSDG
jgi:hypothetical protein